MCYNSIMKKEMKGLKQIKRKVAVFDIDGTIFRSSLLIEVTETLIKEKVFPENTKEIYKQALRRWNDREGEYGDYIDAVVKVFIQNIKGVDFTVFTKVVEKTITENNNKVYTYTRDLIKELKKKNYYILAISHSPQILVENFCRKFGFDKTYGRILEVGADNQLTGVTLYEDLISDKSKVLTRAVEKENLTLVRSTGVGDTESDIVLLKMVERPICFNPNKKLYTHAKKNGWKVVVERKDMIYQI